MQYMFYNTCKSMTAIAQRLGRKKGEHIILSVPLCIIDVYSYEYKY